MEHDRPRVLVLSGHFAEHHPAAASLSEHFDVDVFDTMQHAMEALRHQTYHAVLADVGDFLPLERALVGEQASLVLNTVGEGVCVIDADGICRWSNNRMRGYAPEVFEKVKHICLRARSQFAEQFSQGLGQSEDRPATASRKFSLRTDDEQYYELITSPVIDEKGQVQQVVAVVWDATGGMRLQQKIDAIDHAGRELVRIEGDLVCDMAPDERLKLLRDKIIKYSGELMHFDHFAIRVLDERTNKLEVAISEGLPSESLDIDLYALAEGNGISGYVASRGRSYICHDTARDPRYIKGIEQARSSLTVPLRLHDKVVGVYNIESNEIGAFTEDDRQFAEIFGRYIGLALNVLDLLLVERRVVTGRLTNSVVQEMAEPLNDIVTEAQTLIEEYIGDDTMRSRLNRIVDNVALIRETVKEVAAGTNTVVGNQRVKAPPTDSPLVGKRVLIVDDEENIRNTIDQVLCKYGCKTTVCRDGYEAVHMIEQDHFDVILSDIKMPQRNGYEIFATARKMREDYPVVLMTGFGYDPNHSIVRASQEGLNQVLFKPFKVEQLIDEICKAMRLPHRQSEQSPHRPAQSDEQAAGQDR